MGESVKAIINKRTKEFNESIDELFDWQKGKIKVKKKGKKLIEKGKKIIEKVRKKSGTKKIKPPKSVKGLKRYKGE